MRRPVVFLLLALIGALVPAAAVPAEEEPDYEVQQGAMTIRDYRMLSQGGRTFFVGPRQPEEEEEGGRAAWTTPHLGTNVDANDPRKDLAAGQSEVAVAAWGDKVLAAWNDVSGFFWPDPKDRKGQLTGVGVSVDGGRTFRDLIGLPNSNPRQRWFGDPTIVAVDPYNFIVGGLYLPNQNPRARCKSRFQLAVSVAHVKNDGTVNFTHPIVAADGGGFCDFENAAFLDKELLGYDPVSRTLAMVYTRFLPFNPPVSCGNGQIEMVRARVPDDARDLSSDHFSRPIVVSEDTGCRRFIVQQGADVAVAPGGDAYVVWERNWISNLFSGQNPYIYIDAAVVPRRERAPSNKVTITINQRRARFGGGVKSLDTAIISGYSRGVGNDFPRVEYNVAHDEVVVVWNDASLHPLGDIWLKSLSPGLVDNAEQPIRKVNDDNSYGLHFLPAVSVREDGTTCVSWHDRRDEPDSAETHYMGDCRATSDVNGTDFFISTGPTDWVGTSSLIDPNFGDYTDSASTGNVTYYAWADGRLGVPQPFIDRSGG